MGVRWVPVRCGLLFACILCQTGSEAPGAPRLGDPEFTAKVESIGYQYGLTIAGNGVERSRFILDTAVSNVVFMACAESESCGAFYQRVVVADATVMCPMLLVDQELVGFSNCSLATSFLAIKGEYANASIEPADTVQTMAFEASAVNVSAQNHLQAAWPTASGFMGMAYKALVPSWQRVGESTAFRAMLGEILLAAGQGQVQHAAVVGLDFRPPACDNIDTATSGVRGNGSWLDVGGVDARYRDRILWGEVPVHWDTFHSLRLYHLQICDVGILGNSTSSWPALIDTGSTCLGMPAALYDRLMTYLPVSRCYWAEADALGQPEHLPGMGGALLSPDLSERHSRCWIKEADAARLPSLSFQVAEYTSAGAEERLHIDVRQLLLWDLPLLAGTPEGRREFPLCIRRGGKMVQRPASSNMSPAAHITLGTMALRNFYAALDYEKHLVGLSQKAMSLTGCEPAHEEAEAASAGTLAESTSTREACPDRAICRGAQLWNAYSNRCEPPKCGYYFFMRLNEDDQECEVARGSYTALAVLTTLFLATEVALYFAGQYGIRQILRGRQGNMLEMLARDAAHLVRGSPFSYGGASHSGRGRSSQYRNVPIEAATSR